MNMAWGFSPPASRSAALIARAARVRREVSQCSPTGTDPIPAITTSLMECPLSQVDLAAEAGVGGVVDLRPASNVILREQRPGAALVDRLGHSDHKRV